MKKWLQNLVSFFAFLLALACLAVGFVHLVFSGKWDYPATQILADTSPDGRYQVQVEQLGEPRGLLGPVTAQITMKNTATGKRIAQFKEEVMNDGAGLYESQFTIVWEKDRVKILINPAEAEVIERSFKLN